MGAAILRHILLAAALLATPACSFTFAERPPRHHARLSRFDCTDGTGLATADGVLTGAAVLSAVGALTNKDKDISADQRAESTATMAIMGALFASSAFYGMSVSDDCRRARTELYARTPQHWPPPEWVPPPPQPWMPPPPPHP